MTPERVASLVARWVRFYTRGVTKPVAERRIAELDADLRDHIEHERAQGVGDRRIALAVASRMLRGLVADLEWRRRHRSLFRRALRVAAGVALVLSLPLIAMQFSDQVVWSAADFVIAGVLLAVIGTAFELALSRAGNLLVALTLVAIGVAAVLFGAGDDAPGLVLLGLLLFAGGCAVAVRRLQRAR